MQLLKCNDQCGQLSLRAIAICHDMHNHCSSLFGRLHLLFEPQESISYDARHAALPLRFAARFQALVGNRTTLFLMANPTRFLIFNKGGIAPFWNSKPILPSQLLAVRSARTLES